MIILALDTCLSACSTALLRDDVVLARRVEVMARGHQERLAGLVAETLAEAGLAFRDLNRIAVTVGPGSFTGLRVGLAFAKGLGSALGLPVIGIGTLEAMAAALKARPGLVAVALEAMPGVARVLYPHLDSHPQAALSRKQMKLGGTMVTFEVDGGKTKAFDLLRHLGIIDISNNLGDAKSLMTHPSSTTHRNIGAEARAMMGISDGMLRLSVGLEDTDDLIGDLQQAMKA